MSLCRADLAPGHIRGRTEYWLGDRNEEIDIWTREGGARFERRYVGTIDSSCVNCPDLNAAFPRLRSTRTTKEIPAATQEGCLSFFEQTDKGWKAQLVDMQMPDVTSAFVSPDSRWAVLGTRSGRVQVWDLDHPARPPAIFDARLPWSASFAWLSWDRELPRQWMVVGNSRFGPVASWLIQDVRDIHQPPSVLPALPPTWIDKSGIVSVGAMQGDLALATTDGRLLRLHNLGTRLAIVDRLIDRACEIAIPSSTSRPFPNQPRATPNSSRRSCIGRANDVR